LSGVGSAHRCAQRSSVNLLRSHRPERARVGVSARRTQDQEPLALREEESLGVEWQSGQKRPAMMSVQRVLNGARMGGVIERSPVHRVEKAGGREARPCVRCLPRPARRAGLPGKSPRSVLSESLEKIGKKRTASCPGAPLYLTESAFTRA